MPDGDSALARQLEPGAILVATVLPLAALALEARWAIQYDDDEEPDMEGFEYAMELMERGGMMGAFSLAYSAATGFGDTTARAAHLGRPHGGSCPNLD